MAVDDTIRQISRDKLFSILKSEELVRLFESLLYSLRTTVPTDIASAIAAVDGHIADATGAHQASAIGNLPAGGISSSTVQGALNELDTEKQPTLVSGTNIKTINGASVLGSGDLVISGTGDVVGPGSATDNALALFDGTTGKLLKDSVAVIDADGSLAANSDTRIPTQKAVRTYTARYSRSFLLMGA